MIDRAGFLPTYTKLIGFSAEDKSMLEAYSAKAYFLGRLKLSREEGRINGNQYRLLIGMLDSAIDEIEHEMTCQGNPHWWAEFKRQSAEGDLKERSPEKQYKCQQCGEGFAAPQMLVDDEEVLCGDCLAVAFCKTFKGLIERGQANNEINVSASQD